MHMGIDEPGRDQRRAIVVARGLRMRGLQGRGLAHRGDAAAFDQHRAIGDMAGGSGAFRERIGGEGQNLPQKKIGHDTSLCLNPDRIGRHARKGICGLPLFP